MPAYYDFQNFRGSYALTGPIVDNLVHAALQRRPLGLPDTVPNLPCPYHITLFSKSELKEFSNEQQAQLAGLQTSGPRIFSAGIGGREKQDVWFVVVVWAGGQAIRKQFRLPPKHFHITLSAQDVHNVDKGIETLLPEQFPEEPSPDFLDHLTFTLHSFGKYHDALEFSVRLCHVEPEGHRGFLRLSDAALCLERHKLAMLSCAASFQRTSDQKVRDYLLRKMRECSQFTEWGTIFLEHEMDQLPGTLSSTLSEPWSNELRDVLADGEYHPSLCLEPRQPLFIPLESAKNSASSLYRLPRFFRWLVPFKVAIMSTPKSDKDVHALASPALGIRHVLTLTEEEPLKELWFTRQCNSITNTFIPITNRHPPSIEQMDIIMRLFDDEDNLPLLIHCGGGKGRAGTVAACYLAAYGFQKPQPHLEHPSMSSEEVISTLRLIRPGSIETNRQEVFISKWCSTIWARRSVYGEQPSEPPPCPLEIEGTLGESTNFFLLLGLPGAGKTWFSSALLVRDPKNWSRISQDDSGSRQACETEMGRTPQGRVILDRCNPDLADRKWWLDLGSNWIVDPVCVWFDFPKDLCMSRAQSRVGHPTLQPGNRVRHAVDQMHKQLVRPTLQEGFKAIVTVKSFAASRDFVTRLSPRITLMKFPRTPHLLNLGASTEDDLLSTTQSLISTPGHVCISEKVDGANMGFSLDSDRKLVVQNRSHYVNPSTHEQFKKLGLWMDRHETDLYKILDRDALFPERYILFGEWVYATHSIGYTSLPDRFLAFDLYDRSSGSFIDKASLCVLLRETSIHATSIVYRGPMPNDHELTKMAQAKSAYWDGKREGIYVVIEREGRVVSRGKVVRADFIAGNEHWTRHKLRVNGLSTDDTEV